MAIIGIDLGTTNSLACVCQDGRAVLIPNSLGENLTPSAVSVDENGEICVGAVAKERLISHPEASASSFKRHMGTNKTFTLAENDFTPQELSSFVLRQLKEDAERYLGEEVTEAVISVPAYFNDNQRYATKEAGRLAGIHVERLVNEPSAAALTASRISGEEEGSYLIFDFGGGTLDVSVVDYFDNVIEIVAVSGDNRLGGDDFDEVIARSFCAHHHMDYDGLDQQKKATLLRLSEKCKRDLSEREETVLVWEAEEKKMPLNNLLLAGLSQNLLDRISQVVDTALRDSARSIDEIDEIVLVGGSSRMPVISLYLQTQMKRKPGMVASPDEVVAMGVGIYAGIKERKQDIKDLVLTDICPFTLGVSVVNYVDNDNPIMSAVIERNSVLPCSRTAHYTNSCDNQCQIEIGIFQGESYYCQENLKLGVIEMEILPVKKGEACLEVRFTYDIDGILEVEVTDCRTKQMRRKVLASENLRLSEEEIESRLEELRTYKLMPCGGIRTKIVMARGERLYAQTLGVRRQQVSVMMQKIQKAVASRNDQLIAKCLKEAEDIFDRLEEW
ncbi:MAG: molecular chaperone HscC [Lachnospiraceae bacterium]|nr:molecular chaperone HscC [Lachnospiraceae bacterium]